MVIRLTLLALTSTWWIGCNGSSPSTGSGGSNGGAMVDPERAQLCDDFCRAQTSGSDSPYIFCMSECVSLVAFTEFDHWALAGAEATVKIRETYGFGVAFNDQQLLTSCSISQYDLAGIEGLYSASTNFWLAEPRESADYFSFASFPDMGTGNQVIWGLYDRSTGEEWSGSPGGQVNISCRTVNTLEVMVCEIAWLGDAVENFDPRKMSPSSVQIQCVFTPSDGGGLGACIAGCDDNNPCTSDYCPMEACEHIPKNPFYECDANGGPGVCSESQCIPSPCGRPCGDDDMCTRNACNVETGDCVSIRATYPQCELTE